MLDGQFELRVDGRPMQLSPGDIVIIPSNVPHSGRAIRNCKILDAFHPVREDFVNRNVDYGE
jgi:quercetin dioxygenase-like cupin family protein